MDLPRRLLGIAIYAIRKKFKRTSFAGMKTSDSTEVTYIDNEGFLTTHEHQDVGFYTCGHSADKPRGGVCSVCSGTVCPDCFHACSGCLRPLCPADCTLVLLGGQTFYFCTPCLDEFIHQQKIAKIKGALKSLFVKERRS